MKSTSLFLVLLLGLLAPATSWGQATPANRRQAKRLYLQGKTAQDGGDYDTAASRYEAAYALDPQPAFLFDIAQALRLGGKAKDALGYYQKFLAVEPNGVGSVEARAHVAEITAKLQEEQHRIEQEREAAKQAALQKKLAEQQRQEVIRQEAVRRDHLARVQKLEAKLRVYRYAGLGAGAAGVVSLGVALVSGLQAHAKDNQISGTSGTWNESLDAAVSSGRAANTRMIVFTAIGLAVAATGGVLYYLGTRRERVPPPVVSFRPAVAPGFAGLAVGGGF